MGRHTNLPQNKVQRASEASECTFLCRKIVWWPTICTCFADSKCKMCGLKCKCTPLLHSKCKNERVSHTLLRKIVANERAKRVSCATILHNIVRDMRDMHTNERPKMQNAGLKMQNAPLKCTQNANRAAFCVKMSANLPK